MPNEGSHIDGHESSNAKASNQLREEDFQALEALDTDFKDVSIGTKEEPEEEPSKSESHTDVPKKVLSKLSEQLSRHNLKAHSASSLSLKGHLSLKSFRNIIEAIDNFPFDPEDQDADIKQALRQFEAPALNKFIYPLMDIRKVNASKNYVVAVNVDYDGDYEADIDALTIIFQDMFHLPWKTNEMFLVVLPPDQFDQAKKFVLNDEARSRYLQTVDPTKKPRLLAMDLVQLLIDMPGSDLHLKWAPNGNLVPFIRKDGIIQPIKYTDGKRIELPETKGKQLVTIFMNLAKLDIGDKYSLQDGQVHLGEPGFFEAHPDIFGQADKDTLKKLATYSMRAAFVPTYTGPKLTLRLLHSRKEVKDTLADSRMGLHLVDAIRDTLDLSTGLMVVSGPTGSGKTTTLNRALTEANTGKRSLATIENPVELVLEFADQIEIGSVRAGKGKKAGFADALRSIVRSDPDIILVGETRDYETAENTIQAALTGHLVFTTVHANDALKAFKRFSGFRDGEAEIDLASFLAAIELSYAQRLVREFCADCVKHDHDITPSLNEFFELEGEDALIDPIYLPRPTGEIGGSECPSCLGEGYTGRLALGEVLVVEDNFVDLVQADTGTKRLREFAIQNGNYKPFAWDGFRLMLSGQTDLSEVLRVSDHNYVRSELNTLLNMAKLVNDEDNLDDIRKSMPEFAERASIKDLSRAELNTVKNILLGSFIKSWNGNELLEGRRKPISV